MRLLRSAAKALAIAIAFSTMASNPAWGIERVTIDPGTYLIAGNTITVSWSGAQAEDTISIRQCGIEGEHTICEEDPSTWTVVPASASGAVSFTVKGTLDLSTGLHNCAEWNCSVELISDHTPGEATHDFDDLDVPLHFAASTGYGDAGPADPTQLVAHQTAPPPGDDPTANVAATTSTVASIADLPFTGASLVPAAVTSITLIAVGAFVVSTTRRRPSSD